MAARKPRQGAEVGLRARAGPTQESLLMWFLGRVLRSPRRYRWGLWLARKILKRRAEGGWISRLPGYGAGWTGGGTSQPCPRESFRDWWVKREPPDLFHPDGPAGGSS